MFIGFNNNRNNYAGVGAAGHRMINHNQGGGYQGQSSYQNRNSNGELT